MSGDERIYRRRGEPTPRRPILPFAVAVVVAVAAAAWLTLVALVLSAG